MRNLLLALCLCPVAAQAVLLPVVKPVTVLEVRPEPIEAGLVLQGKNTASEVIPVTDATYAAEVENSSLPVFLDAYADWCGPCKFAAPTIEDLAKVYKGKVKFVKVDVDAEPALAKKLGITKMPTFLLFNKKASDKTMKEVARLIGVESMKDASENRKYFVAAIDKHLLP